MVLKGEPTSNRACKLKLKLTQEQKEALDLNMRISKVAFNWARRYNLNEYEAIEEDKKKFKKDLLALSEEEFNARVKAWTDKETKNKTTGKKENKNLNKYNKWKEEYADDPAKLKEIMVNVLADYWGYDQEKDRITSPFELSKIGTVLRNDKNSQLYWTNQGSSYSFGDTISLDYTAAIDKFKKEKAQAFERVSKKKKEEKTNFRKKSHEYKYPRDFGFPRYRTEANSFPFHGMPKEWMDWDNKRVKLPKMPKGKEWAKIWPNQEIPKFDFPSTKLGSPRVTTDGVDYYFSFAYYAPIEPLEKEQEDVLGIDLGMKNIMICSNGEVFRNIADDEKVKKLNAKLNKLKRKISLLREGKSANCRMKPKKKTTNKTGKVVNVYTNEQKKERWKRSSRQIKKLELRAKKVQIKLNNYKKNEREQIAHDLVAKNPAGIIFENLDVKGMQKNKKNSSKLQQTGLYSMKLAVVKHATKHGIVCKHVDTYFKSSQICSRCGEVHPEMKDLNKRTFLCRKCGLVIDRDVNASYNLKKNWGASDVKQLNLVQK